VRHKKCIKIVLFTQDRKLVLQYGDILQNLNTVSMKLYLFNLSFGIIPASVFGVDNKKTKEDKILKTLAIVPLTVFQLTPVNLQVKSRLACILTCTWNCSLTLRAKHGMKLSGNKVLRKV
jgi:hypothetical protein